MNKRVLLFSILFNMGLILLLFWSWNKLSARSELILVDREWFKVVNDSGVIISVFSDETELTFTVSSGGEDLMVGYVSNDVLEATYSNETPDTVVTIYDQNGDGLPSYRLIRDRATGKVRKEIAVIDWLKVE